MPPHRRRPAPSASQAPPIRRPKVAGLRNRPESEDTEKRATDVLNGVRGTPPKRPVPPAEDETTVLPRIEDPEIDPETNEPPAITEDDEDLAADAESVADTESPADAKATADSESPADTEDDSEEAEPEPKPRRKPRPVATRPAGKRRATGTARPTNLAAAESDAGAEPRRRSRHAKTDDRPARTRVQTQISVAIILAVVAVVLAGLAVFFRGKANDLNSGDTNTALTDTATTSQVKGQLTNAIKQTFSYNYTDLESTERAVKQYLTGKALCEYNLLFGEVKQYAPQQKIILDTTVRELGVVRIDGDRAEALVYIDQLSTRVDVDKTVAVGGQFAVQAHREGNLWKITEFDMFGQPLFNGKPTPTC